MNPTTIIGNVIVSIISFLIAFLAILDLEEGYVETWKQELLDLALLFLSVFSLAWIWCT